MGCEREKMLSSKQGLLIFKGQEHTRAFYARRCGNVVLRVLCGRECGKTRQSTFAQEQTFLNQLNS